MVGRMGRLALGLAGVALAAPGCSGPGPSPIAAACTASAEGVLAALAAAPGAVVLEDGSPLSRCIADGTDDGELQTVGITFSQAAERLRVTAETDPVAALQLGYLAGVTRKGAARTNGVMAELVRRIEIVAGRTVDDATPEARRALERGLVVGARRG